MDIMLDIETMGNGNNAAMIQIAAVKFDRNTGETFGEFCQSISLAQSVALGFQEDESTKKWWQEQNQDVLSAILADGKEPQDVMESFSAFIGKESTPIWSHATFDFPIVQNYLRKFGIRQMQYKMARDIRTLVDLSGVNLDAYDWNKGKTHNALDDCKFQIVYCVDAINLTTKGE